MENVLDQFDDFDEQIKISLLRNFNLESEAHIVASRLKAEGIPCFLSNSNTLAALPIGIGVSLYVREKDLTTAQNVLAQIEHAFRKYPTEEQFYEADEEEIAYQKSLNQPPGVNSRLWYWLILLLVLLIVLRAFFRAAGWVESWRDYI